MKILKPLFNEEYIVKSIVHKDSDFQLEQDAYFKDRNANFSVKVLITGANGLLGYDLSQYLKQIGMVTIETTRCDFDICHAAQTLTFIKSVNPDVIVHCAAYTAVDRAEEEQELCKLINIEGTKHVAEAAREVDARLVLISTDYVFDGEGEKPFTEDSPSNPINVYGYSKQQAERIIQQIVPQHYIVRTSWLFGTRGKHFVKTMLQLAELKHEIKVVHDQVGSPTYTKDLAKFIAQLIVTDKYGTYHGVSEGYCSWYELASSVFEIRKLNVSVRGISSSEYITLAKRPYNSRLSSLLTLEMGFEPLPHWKNALIRYLEDIEH